MIPEHYILTPEPGPRVCAPLWKYYGGKHLISGRYPKPQTDRIVEPFAGAAGYSTRYADRSVSLYDVDERVCQTWEFLIRATARDILSIPLFTDQCVRVDDLQCSQPAKMFVGWWCNAGSAAPCQTLSAWGRTNRTKNPGTVWSQRTRDRIAADIHKINHWKIDQRSYKEIANSKATWFVDPPYQGAGRHYKHGDTGIDFSHLAHWSASRRGHVIACENAGADWLPFVPLVSSLSQVKTRRSSEVFWYRREL